MNKNSPRPKMKNHCLLVVLILIFVQRGSPLLCYECTTLFDEEECGEDFEPEDIEKTECDGTDICMIHVAPEILHFPGITQRGCVDRFYCDKTEEWNEHCLTCEEDLCNRSLAVTPCYSIIVTYFIIKTFQ